jgi:hypothetical protein
MVYFEIFQATTTASLDVYEGELLALRGSYFF